MIQDHPVDFALEEKRYASETACGFNSQELTDSQVSIDASISRGTR